MRASCSRSRQLNAAPVMYASYLHENAIRYFMPEEVGHSEVLC